MARHPQDLVDIATRHQVYLEGLKSSISNDVQENLAGLGKAVTDIVAALEVTNMSELTRAGLSTLLSEVRAVQADMMLKTLTDLAAKLEEVGGYEAGFEATTLKRSIKGLKVRAVSASKAYKAAQAEPLSATGELLDGFLEDWSKKEIKAVNNLVSKGYAQGWTTSQMAQAVRGTKAAGYTDGIVAKIGSDAEAIVHTAVQHVAQAARAQTWASNADIVVGYRFIATLDGNTTPQCRALDGKVFPLGSGPQPPLHYRCRSTTIAELDQKYAFLDEGETRSSTDGPVDGKQTYYDWLGTQKRKFQDSVLGPVRGQLFRDGGLSAERFAQLNLNRRFEPLTLDQMRKLEPLAFQRAGL